MTSPRACASPSRIACPFPRFRSAWTIRSRAVPSRRCQDLARAVARAVVDDDDLALGMEVDREEPIDHGADGRLFVEDGNDDGDERSNGTGLGRQNGSTGTPGILRSSEANTPGAPSCGISAGGRRGEARLGWGDTCRPRRGPRRQAGSIDGCRVRPPRHSGDRETPGPSLRRSGSCRRSSSARTFVDNSTNSRSPSR